MTVVAPVVTPQQTDIPFWRGPALSVNLSPLAPIAGYQGCIALVPNDGATELLNVMYVDKWHGQTDPTTGEITLGDGVTWDAPEGTIVLDVPAGFAIQSGDAVWAWVQKLVPAGDGGRPNGMGGVGTTP
jgi:hypothetical protein